MKQRLLLALLVLFASVGSMWGAESPATLTFTVAQGGSLTVNFSPATGISVGSEPMASKSSYQITTTDTNTSAKTVTINVDALADGATRTITISGSKVTDIATVGNLMTTFTINSVGLENLSIGSYEKIQSLTIGNNNLALDKIPAKSSLTLANAKYSVGTQTPNLEDYGTYTQTPANKGVELTIDKLLAKSGETVPSIANEPAYTIQGWKYKAANATFFSPTSYPHSDASAPNRYYFYSGSTTYVDGNEWMHGDYTCDIKIAETSTKYPGVVIAGIPVKVLAATYIWDKIGIVPSKASSGNDVSVLQGSTPVSLSPSYSVAKGDKFTIIPVPAAGYTFAGVSAFTAKGFTITKNADTDNYTAEVNGKVKEVSLSMAFTAAKQTISYEKPVNGSIEMVDGTTTLANPASVETGKEIQVRFIPAEGYSILKENIFVNGSIATVSDLTAEGRGYVLKYKVTAAETTIFSARFTADTNSTLTVKWVLGDLTDFSVDGVVPSTTDISGYRTRTYSIAYNTTPTIQIVTAAGKTLSSVLVNNEPVEYKFISTDSSRKSTYLITSFTMPNKSVTMVIQVAVRSEAKIIVDGTVSGNVLTYNGTDLVYDGTAKALPYTTDPAGLTGVVVKYKASVGTANAYYTKTEFINAGQGYVAQLTRPADDIYDEAKLVDAGSNVADYVIFDIKEATPIVVTEPTVKIDDKNGGKYVITGGSVAYARGNSKITIESGKYVWDVVSVSPGGAYTTVSNAVAGSDGKYNSEVVTVRLRLKDDKSKDYHETTNYDKNFAKETVLKVKAVGNGADVAQVDLVVYSGLPAGTSLTFMNGTKELGSSAKVPVNSTFDVKVSAPGWSSLKVAQVDNQGNPILDGTGSPIDHTVSGGKASSLTATGTKMIFTITGTAPAALQELVLVSAEDDGTVSAAGVNSNTYDGKVKLFNTGKISVKNKATGLVVSPDWSKATITYKDPNGVATTSPINAGVYTVTIARPADEPTSTSGQVSYKAFTATGKLIIHQATPTIITWPNQSTADAAKIGKGQPLSSAVLTGGIANVEGTFEWVSPTQVVNVDGQYEVKFVSKDTNYKDVVCPAGSEAWVKISNESILSIVSDDTYTMTVKGSDGKEYKSGQTVPVGITLTFTVNPAVTYKLKALYVNGVAISGNTYTTTAGPITVKAEMEQEFTVSVSTTLKGIELVLPTSNVVKKGGDYSFTVKGLAADLAKLVVSDGTNTYTVSNGVCKITNITANKTITVTMVAGATPTPIDVTKIAEVVNSHMGKPMGTIQVEVISATRAASTTAYYGDQIKLTAVPAPGCSFVKWIGAAVPASQATANPLIIELTSAAYEITAQFAGSPTGAEVIEGVDIYGSNGEIVVKCDGAARITIVSMNGQSKQQEISGDTRIPAGAGIYGIVFEQGNNVMRTKVAVK